MKTIWAFNVQNVLQECIWKAIVLLIHVAVVFQASLPSILDQKNALNVKRESFKTKQWDYRASLVREANIAPLSDLFASIYLQARLGQTAVSTMTATNLSVLPFPRVMLDHIALGAQTRCGHAQKESIRASQGVQVATLFHLENTV